MIHVIAIDGPSGSGKSSVAKGVARRFGMEYLDTGAMYRAMTWGVLDRGVDPADAAAVGDEVADIEIRSGTDPQAPTIHVGGTDVADPIRTDRITSAVSTVSAIPTVRAALVQLQRAVVAAAVDRGHGIVVEGRDIGTVVLPDADLKVFLVADAAVRAARRSREDDASQRGSAGVRATAESLARRDAQDSRRRASPLRPADDAVTVDATDLDLPGVINAVAGLVGSLGER